LVDGGSANSVDLPKRTGTNERYIREWLEHHAASGLLARRSTGEPLAHRYSLPAGLIALALAPAVAQHHQRRRAENFDTATLALHHRVGQHRGRLRMQPKHARATRAASAASGAGLPPADARARMREPFAVTSARVRASTTRLTVSRLTPSWAAISS
jgi:hypothetical protein